MRNMSFSMTTEAVRRHEKTVTRRLGWWTVGPGTLLRAIEKGQGLKKGEKIKQLAMIRVVSAEAEPLSELFEYVHPWYELEQEGFAELSPYEFVQMFMKANKCGPGVLVNRIEFEYVEDL